MDTWFKDLNNSKLIITIIDAFIDITILPSPNFFNEFEVLKELIATLKSRYLYSIS